MAEASAPASSANLGPGYDCLAVALELRCSVRATAAKGWEVRQLGPELPDGSDDLVKKAAASAVGAENPLLLEVENHIPIGKGLGSSSAAAAAVITAAIGEMEVPPAASRVFRLVTELEGHADNAAACVFGGLALVGPGGHFIPMVWHDRWKLVVAVPPEHLATSAARSALPPQVSIAAAVRTVARGMALAAGLACGDERLLAEAAGDEIHELPRSPLFPRARLLIDAARAAGAAHVAWSGSGPSVVAVTNADRLDAVVTALREALPAGRVLTPAVAREGVRGVA